MKVYAYVLALVTLVAAATPAAPGHVLDPSKLRKRFGRALDRAELRQITFHELRHTFGTQMAAAGAPLRAIQEWMAIW